MRPADADGEQFEVVSSIDDRDRKVGVDTQRPQMAIVKHNHRQDGMRHLKSFKPPRSMDLHIGMVNREQQKLVSFYSDNLADDINKDPDFDPMPSIQDTL